MSSTSTGPVTLTEGAHSAATDDNVNNPFPAPDSEQVEVVQLPGAVNTTGPNILGDPGAASVTVGVGLAHNGITKIDDKVGVASTTASLKS